MSKPARASAAAAAAGAANTPPESGSGLESGAIGLSRFPKVMSAAARESCRARNEYVVSPFKSRSFATPRPRLISPTANSRRVSDGCWGRGAATTARPRATNATIMRRLRPVSTDHQPRQLLGRVDQTWSRAGRVGIAVDHLRAPPKERCRVRVRDGRELRPGALHVEPAEGDDHQIGCERGQLAPRDRKSTRLNSSHPS